MPLPLSQCIPSLNSVSARRFKCFPNRQQYTHGYYQTFVTYVNKCRIKKLIPVLLGRIGNKGKRKKTYSSPLCTLLMQRRLMLSGGWVYYDFILKVLS